MMNFVVTILVAMAFGILFYRVGVPGGMMVGAVVGVATLNICFDMAYMPAYAKYAAQIVAGAFIGCSVEKSDLAHLKYVAKPAVLLISSMLLLNISLGFIIYLISPLDLLTSLMCAVPGGMSDIPIISADMGADAPKVAVMQFTRSFAGIGLFPSLIALVDRRKAKVLAREGGDIDIPDMTQIKTLSPDPADDADSLGLVEFLKTLTVASALGILGKVLHVPAGALIFSLMGVLALKLFDTDTFMPMPVKRLAQMLSGAYIGSGMGYGDMLELKYLFLPALILLLGYFSTCYFLGKLFNKYFDMSTKEAMLVSTPAGASDMALISSDLGVDSVDLIVLQIIRLLVVVSVFPQIISLILLWHH